MNTTYLDLNIKIKLLITKLTEIAVIARDNFEMVSDHISNETTERTVCIDQAKTINANTQELAKKIISLDRIRTATEFSTFSEIVLNIKHNLAEIGKFVVSQEHQYNELKFLLDGFSQKDELVEKAYWLHEELVKLSHIKFNNLPYTTVHSNF
jgi:predicted ferric reductase